MPKNENDSALEFWKNVDAVLEDLNKAQGAQTDCKGYNDSWLAVNVDQTQASIKLARSRGTVPKAKIVEKMAEVLRVSSSFLRTGKMVARNIDMPLAIELAKIPHYSELSEYLLKMDASQLLELLYEAKMICGEKSL